MGAQITFIIFPPMRWELSKLKKSSYPQSRILSHFVIDVTLSSGDTDDHDDNNDNHNNDESDDNDNTI